MISQSIRWARTAYNLLGFTRTSHGVTFLIASFVLLAFICMTLRYVDIDTTCASPNEKPLDCYFYAPGSLDRVGIITHLATIFPASIFVILQFIPTVRHRFVSFHRINGYLVSLFSLMSMGGVILLLPNVIGGALDTQAAVIVLLVAFSASLCRGLCSAWQADVPQHRAWMLRTWAYVSAVH
jgi:hypothetical protein